MGFVDGLKTRDEVKALFPVAESWLETEYRGADHIFCANVLPSYGSSRIEIHGWIFRRHAQGWERILSVRVDGVGQVKLAVDPKTGQFSAKGGANNRFLNQPVVILDLNATEG